MQTEFISLSEDEVRGQPPCYSILHTTARTLISSSTPQAVVCVYNSTCASPLPLDTSSGPFFPCLVSPPL